MIFLLVIQLTSAVQAYHNTDYERAHRIAQSIPIDSTDAFGMYEILELRAYTATKIRKYALADSLFQIVFECEYESILRKAYTNYAYLQYVQFDFKKRILYLQKAYNLKPTPQLIRIIARHHFQIRADYETAQIWIDRHPNEDSAGFQLLQAEFNESLRRYDQAIDYYTQAKISAHRANLFDYELFAAQGIYRSQRLLEDQNEKKMINWIVWFILGTIAYFYIKKLKHGRHDNPQNQSSRLDHNHNR